MRADLPVRSRGLRRLWRALRNLSERPRIESELDDELAAFIDQLAAEKVAAGADPQAARREARLELGGIEQAKESVRDVRAGVAVERLAGDVRYGARMLRREPTVTAVAVATLALGIGAGTAVFSVARAVLWRPLPFAAPESLVVVEESDATFDGGRFSVAPPNYLDWSAESRTFGATAAFAARSFNLVGDGAPQRLDGLRVSAGYFELLGLRPLAGRWFRRDEDAPGRPPVAILGEDLWRRRFAADPGVVGRTVRLDDRAVEVIGVASRSAALPGQVSEVWVPLALDERERASRRSHFLATMARLAPGATLAEAQEELSRIAERLREAYPQSNASVGLRVRDLREALVGRHRSDLWLLLAMAAVLLLVTCANVANLLLARGIQRQREVAVRAALGAGSGRIVRQLLVEATMLALAGGAAGIVVGALVLRTLVRGLSFDLPGLDAATLDPLTLTVALVATVSTGLVFGAAPALRASRVDLTTTLRAEGSRAGGAPRARLQSALASFQVGLAFVLAVASLLLVRSVRELESVPRGFDSEHRLTLELALTAERYRAHGERARAYREILDRARALDGVEAAGMVSFLPLDFRGGVAGISIEGAPTAGGELRRVSYRVISGDYFRAIGIPVIRGRALSDVEAERRSGIAVIDETAAERYFANRDPIGARVKLGEPGSAEPWLEVVAVVGRTRLFGLADEATPALYLPNTQPHAAWATPRALVVSTAGDPRRIVGELVDAVARVDPDLPLTKIRTMNEVVADSIGQERARRTVALAFGLLAVALVAIGVYGVSSFVVAQQRRELGLRQALGALPRDIVAFVAVRGLRLVAAGLVPGLILAVLVARGLSGWLYGVGPFDPNSYLASAGAIAVLAILACWIPAVRALRVPPEEVFRSC